MNISQDETNEILAVSEKIRTAVPPTWACITIIVHPSGGAFTIGNVADDVVRRMIQDVAQRMR